MPTVSIGQPMWWPRGTMLFAWGHESPAIHVVLYTSILDSVPTELGLPIAPDLCVGRNSSLYPTIALLSAWSEQDWRQSDGVQLEQLSTCSGWSSAPISTRIFVRAGASGEVLMRGGIFFQQFTEAILTGSSLGGAFLKQRGIYVGLRIEFNVDGETLLTAPIFNITVCPLPLEAAA